MSEKKDAILEKNSAFKPIVRLFAGQEGVDERGAGSAEKDGDQGLADT